MEQLPVVSVREVSASLETTVTAVNDISRSTTHEKYEEYGYQSDGLTTHQRVKTRIQRTLAIMTRNLYASSDSEENSVSDMDFPRASSSKPNNDSEVSEPTSVSASDASRVMIRLPPRLRRPTIVRKGRKVRSSSSTSDHDSGISWIGENTEEGEEDEATRSSSKDSKGKGSKTNLPHSISNSQLVYRSVRHALFDGEKESKSRILVFGTGALEEKELLSGWGGSSFSNPPELAFGPVQVNFPETTTSRGHTELYDTRSEAITAIFHKNRGEFDSLCTFDPTIRVIFVHPVGKFIPDYDEIGKLGLELLSLPTHYNFNQAYYPRPLFTPQNKCSSVHEIRERISGASELAGVSSETHPATGKGKAGEKIEGQSTIDVELAHSIGMVPPNSPSSSTRTSPDLADWEKEGSTFDDDFFLEVDLANQRSNSTCGLSQANSDQADSSQQSDSASLNQHSVSHEAHNHIWDAKTWPDLGREYITAIGPSDSRVSVDQKDMYVNKFLDDVELGSEGSISANTSYHKRHRQVSSSGDFELELQEAENRSLQQAIDEIVAMKGNTLERGVALFPKNNFQVNVKECNLEENIVHTAEVRQQESDIPCIQNIIDRFEDRAAKSRVEKQEMCTFSYPLEYSPAESKIDLSKDHYHYEDINRFYSWNQRCCSDTSNQSNASGFRFTDYIQELAEIASNGSASVSNASHDMGKRAIARVESCKPPVDANGSPRPITAEDLNVRLVGKAAQESKLAKQEAKGGALVGLFQSHGLMPQSQPTLRSPTTLGPSPFKNITNQMPSSKSSPTATQSGNANVDVEKAAKATAFKRAFSELSVGSSSHDTDTLDFGEAYQVLEQMRLL